jgi:hypothetical protein
MINKITSGTKSRLIDFITLKTKISGGAKWHRQDYWQWLTPQYTYFEHQNFSCGTQWCSSFLCMQNSVDFRIIVVPLHFKRRKSKLVWSTLLFEIKGLAVLLCSFYTRAESASIVFVALAADFMKDTIHQVDQQLFTLSAFPCHCQISTSILDI